MFKSPKRAVLLMAFLLVIPTASDRVLAADPEQTVPQGEDPPGADEGGIGIPAPSDHKGVIPPPDIGDEGIHTDVPNPDAGTEEK